jgi:DegV family protein with EDD domain
LSLPLRIAASSPLDADTRSPNTAANDRRIPDIDTRLGQRAQTSTSNAFVAKATTASDRSRTLLVVDAACDMPSEWLAKNGVTVLPITVSVDDWTLLDTHNEFDAMEFFRKDIASRGARASTTPLSPAETRDFVQSNLDLNIDYVLQITIAGGRSKIYLNSLSAMHGLTAAHNRARRGLGNREPFRTWVIDSETGFTGQGVMIAEAVRQLNAGVPAAVVASSMEQLRQRVHTFMVPKDLFYLYSRAKAKGDSSLSWLSYNVARALDVKPIVHAHGGTTAPILKVRGHLEALERIMHVAIDHVKRGLTVPTVCVSYAGNLEDVRTLAVYRELRVACQWHKVELILSTMSMTGGLNVGADAFSIAFACESLDMGQ